MNILYDDGIDYDEARQAIHKPNFHEPARWVSKRSGQIASRNVIDNFFWVNFLHLLFCLLKNSQKNIKEKKLKK